MELRDLDMESPRGERPRRPQKPPHVLKAAAALLLIILLLVFFGGTGGDRNAAKELEEIKSRLDGIEKVFARVEAVEQKISTSESQMGDLRASVISLEMAARNLETLTGDMKTQLERSAQTAPPKSQPQTAAPEKRQNAVERRFHEVRRGETVFSIARKYGMSAEELRRVNHLSKNLIQPGQKLAVDSGK